MKITPRQIVKDMLTWIYWYPCRFLVRRLPLRITYLLARITGRVAYYILTGRRRSLERELSFINANGKMDGAGKIIRNSFVVFSLNRMEVLLYPELSPDNIKKIVKYSGLERLDNALASGKGVILLFSHFGANQIVMPAIGHLGYRMSQLSASPTVWKEKLTGREFSSMGEKALELRWRHEQSLPVKHINIFGSLKDAFLCLKKNEILGIAIDGGGGKDRVEVDFLGRKAMFSTGAIDLALRTGSSVLPVFMLRDENGYNTMLIEEPMELSREVGDSDAVKRNTEIFVERLEEYVLKYPWHYLNFLAFRTLVSGHGDTPFFTSGKEEKR